MNRNIRVFWISLILSTLTNLQYGSNLILPLLRGGPGGQDINFYRSVFELLWYALSFVTIILGYRIGRDADLKTEYLGFVKSLGAGWIASSLIFIPLYLSSDDVWQSIASLVTLHGFTDGVRVAAVLFSTITLGWITRDGIRFNREWNPVILRPVLVYNGALLLRSLAQRILSYMSINSSNRGALIGYMTALSWGVFPIWLWFMFRMLSSGNRIDFKEDYGGILYTIWLPSIVYNTLSHLVIIVFYYMRAQSWSMLLDLPVAYGLRLTSTTLGVLGLPFSLLCYGYLNSRYRYNVQLNKHPDPSHT